MTFDAAAFAARVASALPKRRPLALHEPSLTSAEAIAAAECVYGGWISGNGPYVARFEEMLAARLGVPHVIATNTGTAALHVALLCAGVRPGDEVMMPALTFVATANAVRYCGATPHFVDSDEREMRLPEAAAPRAVVRVHLFGHFGAMAIPNGFAAPVIEDAAESLGSEWRERPAASFGAVAVLSFNGNKIITTGQGGAIVTHNPEIARRARHLVNTAKLPHAWEWEHDEVGFNYRMPDLNAALGIAQLARLDEFVTAKRALARRYRDALADLPGVVFVSEPPGCRSNYWLSAALVPDAAARDAALAALHADGIQARGAWKLISDLPVYRDCPRGDLTVARDLAARLICLPSGAGLA